MTETPDILLTCSFASRSLRSSPLVFVSRSLRSAPLVFASRSGLRPSPPLGFLPGRAFRRSSPLGAPRGRPSLYTDELAEDICEGLAEGRSLRAICAEPGMPDKATVMRWLNRHDDFRKRYRNARELQIDTLADELVEIADSAERARDHRELAKAKRRIGRRKWLITHLAAKKYGSGAEVGGTGEAPMPPPVLSGGDKAVV